MIAAVVSNSPIIAGVRAIRMPAWVSYHGLTSRALDSIAAAMNLSTPHPILSPCVGICHLGADGYCEGCLRSGEEIARWIAMGEAERRRIVEEVLPQREARRT